MCPLDALLYATVVFMREMTSDSGLHIDEGSEGVIVEVLSEEAFIVEIRQVEPRLEGGYRYDTCFAKKPDVEVKWTK